MRIGITERGDAGLDLSWNAKLRAGHYDGAILITKNANRNFQTHVLDLYRSGFQNLILHITCTGLGGTTFEPYVPRRDEQLSNLQSLIQQGFPQQQIVLRIDPILPTTLGMACLDNVLSHPIVHTLQAQGPLRIRISLLDLYRHVKDRLALEQLSLPWYTFHAPYDRMLLVAAHLANHPGFVFETCAEDHFAELAVKAYPQLTIEPCGCLSEKDFAIWNLTVPDHLLSGMQRNGCHCLSCKSELLTARKRCSHQCLYCYWKD